MKARHRERLACAVLLIVATLLFGSDGQLDLWISQQFYADGRFVGNDWLVAQAIYHGTPWAGMAVLAVAALRCVRAARRLNGPLPWRGSASLLLVAVLGVGLLVHTALKDGWGRARPADVQAFGGPKAFTPALQPADHCRRNCSFVSGHAAAGFALLAFGLFGRVQKRRRWLLAALVAGTAIGLARVSQGRHFASDIVFCFSVLWILSLVLREGWLRFRLARWAVHRSPGGITQRAQQNPHIHAEARTQT
jgi:lipid A 4'-phosphatase